MWCFDRPDSRRSSARGFTLIEMLVVMVLLGMLTSMALPSMQRWHDAVQAKTQVSSLMQSVRAAMFAAGAQRRLLRLTESSFEPGQADGDPQTGYRVEGETLKLRLPPGWQVRRVGAAAFLSSGLCEPGEVELATESEAVMVLRISGPLCDVSLTAGERA